VSRGEIEVLEIGRLKKPITAPLRRKLGLDESWQQIGDVARTVASDIETRGRK
jgi:hypothetical protein